MDPKCAFIAIGIVLIGLAIYRLAMGLWSLSWPTTEAYVSEFFPYRSARAPAGKESSYLGLTIKYTYRINMIEYSSRRLWFGGIRFSSYTDLVMLMKGLNVGAKTRIYYLSWFPAIAVLKPGIRWDNILLILIGLFFLFPIFIAG